MDELEKKEEIIRLLRKEIEELLAEIVTLKASKNNE
tara:strand:+ start:763 stop:870 length:108 start_codon:yes stop_codon:yes gene_type:complete